MREEKKKVKIGKERKKKKKTLDEKQRQGGKIHRETITKKEAAKWETTSQEGEEAIRQVDRKKTHKENEGTKAQGQNDARLRENGTF